MLISQLFRNDARDPDRMLATLNEQGFDFFTVDDWFAALENRLSTGKPQFGDVANGAIYEGAYSIAKTDEARAMEDAAKAWEDLTPEALENMRRVIEKQMAEVRVV